ncbi:MAG: acyloxyacyl hydrolase, partial [Bacteroidales bacterium]|nr:acyloxyacyl hydrolase [Bacteroidales bacterium]
KLDKDKIILELLRKIEELIKEVQYLKERLSKYEAPKNSNKSSIYPSKDENCPKRKSLRERTERKPGGQKWRKVNTLKIFFLLYFLLFIKVLYAGTGDTIKDPFIIGLRAHYGFIIAHSKYIKDITHSNPIGIEVDFNRHLLSKKAWEYCNCYPRMGVSLYYWNYQNPSTLGNGLTLLGYVEPFIKAQNRINFSIRAGLGIAYLDNPYDEIKNPKNLCYSTSFSFALLVNISCNYKINKKLNFNIIANYNHISNGGIKQPNKGLNFPSFSLGLDYNLNPVEFKDRNKTYLKNFQFNKKRRVDLGLIFGYKGIYEDNNIYFIKGIYINVSQPISRLSALSAGLEWISDGAEKEMSKLFWSVKKDSHLYGSFLCGYEFLMGRFILSGQFGVYIYNICRRTDIVYQRYGLRYNISDSFFAGINLKAHRHAADFFDMRIGLSF